MSTITTTTLDDELAVALARLDRAALRIASDPNLDEDARHANLADLSAAYAAICWSRRSRCRHGWRRMLRRVA